MSDDPLNPLGKNISKALESLQKQSNAFSDLTKAIAMPDIRTPAFDMPDLTPHVSVTNPAKWTHKRLVDYINDFEKELDDEHEIGARLVSFGRTVTFHIEDISFWGPDIITFHGINENGEKVQLIQHTTQLSVLLVAMKKLEEKPRRIGFQLTKDSCGDEAD